MKATASGQPKLTEREILERHPVALELARAEAACWLLGQLDDGLIGEQGDEDMVEWIAPMALRELTGALKEAHVAFVKAAELHRKAVA